MRYFDHDRTRRSCQGLASNVESERAHYLYSPRIRERLSEKSASNGPSEDLAAIRSTKWTEKPLLGGPVRLCWERLRDFSDSLRRGLLGNWKTLLGHCPNAGRDKSPLYVTTISDHDPLLRSPTTRRRKRP